MAFAILRNGYWVITSWLGFNHRILGKGKPLIFETMVFYANTYRGVAQRRYSTEAKAVEGHLHIVEEWMVKPKAKRPKDVETVFKGKKLEEFIKKSWFIDIEPLPLKDSKAMRKAMRKAFSIIDDKMLARLQPPPPIKKSKKGVTRARVQA